MDHLEAIDIAEQMMKLGFGDHNVAEMTKVLCFEDGNILDIIHNQYYRGHLVSLTKIGYPIGQAKQWCSRQAMKKDIDHNLHSSLIRRLFVESELKLLDKEGSVHSLHSSCLSWNREGSCLIAGSSWSQVKVEDPHVVLSASYDGTVRQHDFREHSSCQPASECRSVLFNLRRGGKVSLADSPNQRLLLSSVDICSTQPHLLLVSGSDALARLYDRRTLPTLSSYSANSPLPDCINYFCRMHLSCHIQERSCF